MTRLDPNPYLAVAEARTVYEVLDATRVSTQALYLVDRVTPARYVAVLLRRLVDVYAAGNVGYWIAAYGVAWEVARCANAWSDDRALIPVMQLPAESDHPRLDALNRDYETSAFEGRFQDADRLVQAIAYDPDITAAVDRRREAHAAMPAGRVPWDEARQSVDPVCEAMLHLLHSMMMVERAAVEGQQ